MSETKLTVVYPNGYEWSTTTERSFEQAIADEIYFEPNARHLMNRADQDEWAK